MDVPLRVLEKQRIHVVSNAVLPGTCRGGAFDLIALRLDRKKRLKAYFGPVCPGVSKDPRAFVMPRQ